MAVFNSKLPIKINPTTPIKLYTKEINYVPGQGNTTAWQEITSGDYSVFYGEWRNMYGDRAISAETLGVKDSATFRTFYNPNLYNKLRTVQVIVIKNADETVIKDGTPDKNNPNCYELWGGVDNILEENQFMEFRVRRYEGL